MSKDRIYHSIQDNFTLLPGSPIAYWASDALLVAYKSNLIGSKYKATVGIQTGNNNLFLRYWFEVERNNIDFEKISDEFTAKWYSHPKGGAYRKWYGNYEYIINWQNNGADIKQFLGQNISVAKYNFNGLCWSHTTSGAFSARLYSKKHIPNLENPVLFCDGEDQTFLLGLMNSKMVNYLLNLLNSTLHYHVGDILRIPLKVPQNTERINNVVEECISLAKKDWDSFETSWDFERHPLI